MILFLKLAVLIQINALPLSRHYLLHNHSSDLTSPGIIAGAV